jgi:hypothetical protein
MISRSLIVVGVAILAVTGATAPGGVRAQVAAGGGFVLHLPRTVDMTHLDINYFLIARRGGVGGLLRTSPRVWEYTIPTTTEYGEVTAFKAAIFLPGYSIVLIDVPSLDVSPRREMTIDLTPLPLVVITGRVVPPPGLAGWPAPVMVEVAFGPTWHCEFYGLVDCLIGNGKIAESAPVGADGAFSIAVADLARDPALAQFRFRGQVCFTLRETGRDSPYNLEIASSADGSRSKPCFDASSLSAGSRVLYASLR